jgi:hypothetical protein
MTLLKPRHLYDEGLMAQFTGKQRWASRRREPVRCLLASTNAGTVHGEKALGLRRAPVHAWLVGSTTDTVHVEKHLA